MIARAKQLRIAASFLVVPLTMPGNSLAMIWSLEISPTQPTQLDTITFTVQGWLPDLCWDVQNFFFVQVSPTQFDASVFAIDAWQPGMFCLPVVVDYDFSETFGPLAPGNYSVVVSEIHQSMREPWPDSDFLSFEVRDFVPLVQGLVALVSGSDFVLHWTAVEGATGYKIYRAIDPLLVQEPINLLDSTVTPGYTDSGVIPSPHEKYFYCVTVTQ